MQAKIDGKWAGLPEALCNYRHPAPAEIDRYRSSSGPVTTRMISVAEHDRRVTELLASNNALLERARKAEGRAAAAERLMGMVP